MADIYAGTVQIRHGERAPIYSGIMVDSGTLVITAATFMLYSRWGSACMNGGTAVNATNYSGTTVASPEIWYDLHSGTAYTGGSALPRGDYDGQFIVTGTVSGDGFPRIYKPVVLIQVE